MWWKHIDTVMRIYTWGQYAHSFNHYVWSNHINENITLKLCLKYSIKYKHKKKKQQKPWNENNKCVSKERKKTARHKSFCWFLQLDTWFHRWFMKFALSFKGKIWLSSSVMCICLYFWTISSIVWKCVGLNNILDLAYMNSWWLCMTHYEYIQRLLCLC